MKRQRMRVVVIAAVLVAAACSRGDERPTVQTATTTPTSPSPSPEQTEASAPGVTPADAVFEKQLPGYSYQRDREVEQLYESQFEMIFASAPAGLGLHSVAARRVVDEAGDVQGSLLTISVDLADASMVPKFQEGLLSGLGEELREVEIKGTPAFYKENFTANGQDLIVFFYEGTLAVEAFGVTPAAAKDMAAALVQALTR